MKTLKIWNGRGHGKYDKYHIYVAAYSSKQACEIIGIACELGYPISTTEINVYYSKGCWGNAMSGIEPTEPCVYVKKEWCNETPIRIF